jgi:hypothetical protein
MSKKPVIVLMSRSRTLDLSGMKWKELLPIFNPQTNKKTELTKFTPFNKQLLTVTLVLCKAAEENLTANHFWNSLDLRFSQQ